MNWSQRALATLAITFVFALYLVGYFAMIERQSISFYNHGFETLNYYPSARVGGRATELLYYPITELDYLLRPDHWEPVERELPRP